MLFQRTYDLLVAKYPEDVSAAQAYLEDLSDSGNTPHTDEIELYSEFNKFKEGRR